MKQSFLKRSILVAAAVVLSGLSLYAQQNVTVSGVVTDPSGLPIVGAAVFEQGTGNGVSTDIDGKYSISVRAGAALTYSCIGYTEQTHVVSAGGTVNVVLTDDSTLLDETVVIGYGVQKKSDVTGAIASVGRDALENRSVSDVAAALTGKSAGVQVISSSGQPGEIGTIRIRGLSSNSSSATAPLYIVDGLQISNLSTVDPQNVESIEILKDAASAAIYGAQAGNGVVLITTKTGKRGEGRIFYDGSWTVEKLGYAPTMMNAAQYIDYMTSSAVFTQSLVDEYWDGRTDTDWFGEAFPGGHAVRHTVGLQGANDKGSYYTSLSYVGHDGILYGDRDKFKRTNVQLNADYRIKDWLKIGTTNTFTMRRTLYMGAMHAGEDTMMAMVYALDPLTPMLYPANDPPVYIQDALKAGYPVITTPDGDYISSSQFVSRSFNPLFFTYRYTDSWNKSYDLNGTMYANLTPFKGLVITSRFGYHFGAYDSYIYLEPYWASGTQSSANYSLENSISYGLGYQWENFANYSHTFGRKHNFDAMAGMSWHESNSSWIQASGDKLSDYAENFRFISFITSDAADEVAGAPFRSATLSYFGRLGYNYDNRYFLQLSFRADAFDSSYLAASNRWGRFPSISLGWNITNEPFMKNRNKDALSFLKLRASYGTNGNIAALGSGYTYDATVSIGESSYQMSDGSTITLASYPSKLSNPSLKWETSRQLDLGLDARFLSDRLTLGVDCYNKDTDDLIVAVTPSYTTGQSSVFMNSGSVNNKGVEIELSWKDAVGDFSYGISGNIARNRNKVTYLDPTLTRINGTYVSNNHYATVFEEGYPVWYMRGYVFDGVDPETGASTFKDITDDGEITEADQTMIGSAQPDFTYGLTLAARYKGFDFTVSGSGSQGNDIWFGMLRSDCKDRNLPAVFYTDAWKKTGDTARYPVYGEEVSSYYYRSSACIYDGSYFRVNQIQLGYSLPKKLLGKVRAYVSLDDFFTFSKYIGFDPVTAGDDSSLGMGIDRGTYPSAKKVMFGLNLSF